MAKFIVRESNGNYHMQFTSSDNTSICIDAKETNEFNSNSIFGTLQNASNFFENGSAGYSPNGEKYEGLKLEVYKWQVQPLEVFNVKSSFFENEIVFPIGSIKFDNALLMTKVEHEWISITDKHGKY